MNAELSSIAQNNCPEILFKSVKVNLFGIFAADVRKRTSMVTAWAAEESMKKQSKTTYEN